MPLQTVPAAAVGQYQQVQGFKRDAVRNVRRAWGEVDPRYISESWREMLPIAALAVADVQLDAAEAGAGYSAAALAQRGEYEPPAAFVDAGTFVGVMPDGGDLEAALYMAAPRAKALIGQGAPPAVALRHARDRLDLMVGAVVSDTGRAAASVDVTARQSIGYTRMLNPPSCSRCAILAGRWYRWNTGFDRHPRCDCIHVSSKNVDVMRGEGLLADPYEYFRSLSPEDQVKIFGRSEARAITDGADIFQVVNARRGMTKVGTRPASRARTTTEGITRRGNFGRSTGKGTRLTVDEIYRTAGTRTRALRMLEENGYILPGGQNPHGSIVGQREGFGALGRGGTRRAATEAVLEARRTGRRDPTSRYTMTEAERRTHDAARDWEMVQKGFNPYQAGASQRYAALMAGRPAPRGGSLPRALTDGDKARAESAYRRFVLGLDGGDPAVRK